MRFPDIYTSSKGPVISFEVYPPKTEAGEAKLRESIRRLRQLDPRFMTCTYGAGGSTRRKTIEIAAFIQNEVAMECACHLTCVGASRDELRMSLRKIQEAGIENIVALRGDPPRDTEQFRPAPDGLAHGRDLVAFIRAEEARSGQRLGVGVAGYPETHPEAPDSRTDAEHLKAKVEAGGDVIFTQLFFNNEDFYRFRDRIRALGVSVPVIPGLMPVQSTRQIEHITTMCGATIPERLKTSLTEGGEDPGTVEEIGARYCLDQVRDLLDNGVPGIHFYVLNRTRQMAFIMEGLGL